MDEKHLNAAPIHASLDAAVAKAEGLPIEAVRGDSVVIGPARETGGPAASAGRCHPDHGARASGNVPAAATSPTQP